MATSKPKRESGYENHGEDSTVQEGVSKGTFFQVGTVAPMSTASPTSVNQKSRGAEKGE